MNLKNLNQKSCQRDKRRPVLACQV